MPNYKVFFKFVSHDTVEVEAENEQEAIEMARDIADCTRDVEEESVNVQILPQ